MHSFTRALKALSDETRVRIVNIILERECCVCEVMQALNISQTRASRNLGILYEAGLLKQRRDGLWSLYSINWQDIPDYMPYLVEAVKRALYNVTVVSEDIEHLKKAKRVGPDHIVNTED